MDKYELRSRGRTLSPIMNIGKEGLTPAVVKEIKEQLRKKKLIKIKMLGTVADTKDKKAIAKELAELTDSVLVDHIGFVYVLADKALVRG